MSSICSDKLSSIISVHITLEGSINKAMPKRTWDRPQSSHLCFVKLRCALESKDDTLTALIWSSWDRDQDEIHGHADIYKYLHGMIGANIYTKFLAEKLDVLMTQLLRDREWVSPEYLSHHRLQEKVESGCYWHWSDLEVSTVSFILPRLTNLCSPVLSTYLVGTQTVNSALPDNNLLAACSCWIHLERRFINNNLYINHHTSEERNQMLWKQSNKFIQNQNAEHSLQSGSRGVSSQYQPI